MSAGKAGAKQQVIDYRASLHLGVCAKADAIVEVRINDKEILDSEITENTVLDIQKPELFGGPKKGGGAIGKFFAFFGGPDQVMPEEIATKLGRTSSTLPGFRNILSVFFSGFATEGFTWSSNNPQIPSVEVLVRRQPTGLDGDPMIGLDANPAHILHECLTDRDWGFEYPNINVQSFLDAAETFREEGLGLSYYYNFDEPLEEFINEVLATVNSVLEPNLSGDWTLKPLRGDYTEEGLVEINPRNGYLRSFERRAWGEVVNQVVLSYRNRDTNKNETVTQQDPSGFVVQGAVVSDSSKNFRGIKEQQVALDVAERELRSESSLLATVSVDVDPSFSDISVGDVVRFNWDETDEDGDVFHRPIVCRVVKVSRSLRSDAPVRLGLSEDVFGMRMSTTSAQQNQSPSASQEPSDPQQYLFMDAPYFVVASSVGDSDARNVPETAGSVAVLVQPEQTDIREIELLSYRPVPDTGAAYVSVGSLDDVGYFTTTVPTARGVSSVIMLPGPSWYHENMREGSFIVFTAPGIEEVGVVTSVSDSEITVRRGCLDTVPQTLPTGTGCWVVGRTQRVLDETEVLVGDDLDYKLLPVTSLGRLPESQASTVTFSVSDRMHRPLRPANVQLDGVPGFSFTVDLKSSSSTVSWSNRNRVTETAVILNWDDPTTPGEVGQTTSVELWKDGMVVFSALGVSGESVIFDPSSLGVSDGDTLELRVWSVRDGVPSWQIGTYVVEVVDL